MDSAIKIYAEGNDRYVSLDKLKFRIPAGVHIADSNIYEGICELRSDSLIRRSFLITKRRAFLTTFEDVGFGTRGHLYVFDRVRKTLIDDPEFDREYLYSPTGSFVIGAGGDRIFCLGMVERYSTKDEDIITADLYEVKGSHFKNIKVVYEVRDEVPEGAELVSFYKNSLLAKSRTVFILPRNWNQIF